ncbi:(deoxy)nucleoside triphosphate pyrophosphohydrolase [Glaciecola sp. MF2-115]|uniref:(deoxy)nucleoside triphosphate pyrophosphohydrolase n=1 Tax=Glaciecola sp. MF2-115 TaxID=3384827 RepID=UPI00399F9A1F
MIEVVAAVIEKNGLILCFKKGKTKFDYLSYKYEFPGGKVETNEDHRQALKREIKEELHTDIVVGDHLISAEYEYPDFSIRLHFYACTSATPIQKLTEHLEVVSLSVLSLKELEWLPADLPAVDYLVENAQKEQQN